MEREFPSCPRRFRACMIEKHRCLQCGLDQRGRDSLLNREIGDYRLIERAEDTLFGTAYLAHSLRSKEMMRLHLLRPAVLLQHHDLPFLQQRLRLAVSLRHQGIAPLSAWDECEEGFYWISPWLQGLSLQQHLRIHPLPFPLLTVFDLTLQLLHALAICHRHGLIIGHLRPEKILLIPRKERFQLCILDLATEPLFWTRELQMLLSPEMRMRVGAYLPPEQMRASPLQPQESSDLYTVSLLLCQMLSGRLPFRARNWDELYHKHRYAPLPRLTFPLLDTLAPALAAQIEPLLSSLLHRGLAKDPRHRFPSSHRFAAALGEIIDLLPPTLHQQAPSLWLHTRKNLLDKDTRFAAYSRTRKAQKPPRRNPNPSPPTKRGLGRLWSHLLVFSSIPSTTTSPQTALPEGLLRDLQSTLRRRRRRWIALTISLFLGILWVWLYLLR